MERRSSAFPFYLADDRLERIEAEHSGAVESDDEAMRYLRHEGGARVQLRVSRVRAP